MGRLHLVWDDGREYRDSVFYAATTGPALTLTPSSGPSGTSVAITGNGFAANESVMLHWGGLGHGTGCDPAGMMLTSATASSAGALNVSITVPACARPGVHSVLAVGTHTAVAAFTVPHRLAITRVDPASPPPAPGTFSVTAQSQDANGTLAPVTQDTTVTLSRKTGTGTLGGTLTGTIPDGADSVTISGLTYSRAENGVVLTATVTAGDTLTPGDSAPFNVARPPFTVTSTVDAVDANPGDGMCETAPGNGVCTLRAAIQETNALAGPDTIVLPAGTYTLTIPGQNEDAAATGDLDITEDLTITGAGAENTIIQACEVREGQTHCAGIDRVFHIVTATSSGKISGTTIRHGGIWFDHGGGIYNSGSLSVVNTIIHDNHTNIEMGHGGGPKGGGIYNKLGTVIVLDSIMADNRAHSGGGSILNDGGTVIIKRSTISGNSVGLEYPNDGGGGVANNGGVADIAESILIGNTAGSGPGGAVSNAGTLYITNSTISNNTAGAFGSGGGVSNSGTLVLMNSSLSNNSAPASPGGGLGNSGTAAILSSTMSGNIASSDGGGIFTYGGMTTITNSTLVGNSAGRGSGIGNGFSGTGGGTVRLAGTILAHVTGGNCVGSVNTLGHNLSSDASCGLTGPGDLQNTDPKLGPLADNGGPTLTHALLPGSPAIDAIPLSECTDSSGNPLTTDQRGLQRPGDGNLDGVLACDIGAFEELPVLAFTTQPAKGAHGFSFGAQPAAEVRQRGAKAAAAGSILVTLRIRPGTGAPGATLTCSGGLTQTVAAGVAAFTDCMVDLKGQGYVLEASAPGIGPSESQPFDVGWAGDTSGDCQVSGLDFSILAAGFGKGQGQPGYDPRADLNGDNLVNLQDFSILATLFATRCPSVTASASVGSGGTAVTVTGSAYVPNRPVVLSFDGAPLVPVPSVSADGAGSFTATFPVPAGTAAGSHVVKASQAGGRVVAAALLTLQ